ncbi:MAG: alkaline phosphatase family protein, partial [Myxococcales bacterium]|nr:alkaline phosphatase family protein [Myxococcales bacterium]
FHEAAATGAFHHVAYPYAGTYTAPGHASLATGSVPAVHGVSANKYWNALKHHAENGLDDPAHPMFGAKDGASPSSLRLPTVGEALKATTGDRGKSVSLSLKDRGAVLVGGHHADAVLWYEDSIPGFTTSTYYAKELPAWVADWTKSHPVSDYLTAWNPEDPALLERTVGPDDQPGEGGAFGLGATFPHDPRAATDPADTFRATPGSALYLLDFAKAAYDAEDLCKDAIPDLLTVSVSTTDYVGHTFGPDSWEYLDNLRRVDRALGAFVRWVRERCPHVSFVLSSDHGHAPLVERSQKEGRKVVRVGGEVTEKLNAAVVKKLGKGTWVEAFIKPLVHLSDAGEKRRAEILPILKAELATWPSVHSVYDPREAETLAKSEDPVARAAALSVDDLNRGDLFIVPAPYNVFDEGGKPNTGTSHGTPWDYDQVVPGLAWGMDVSPSRSDVRLSHARIAATLAALLGVPAPNDNHEPALPGVHAAGAAAHVCPCEKDRARARAHGKVSPNGPAPR